MKLIQIRISFIFTVSSDLFINFYNRFAEKFQLDTLHANELVTLTYDSKDECIIFNLDGSGAEYKAGALFFYFFLGFMTPFLLGHAGGC